jgi:hypothetical protein
MTAITSGMTSERLCKDFPDLLATDMSKKGPNKALDQIFKDRKPNSPDCEAQVQKIRRLENDSRFETDQTIRERWSRDVKQGTSMGCEF